MIRPRLVVCVGSLAALFGCIDVAPDPLRVVNACTRDVECGPAGRCDDEESGICTGLLDLARAYSFVIDITLPANVLEGGGTLHTSTDEYSAPGEPLLLNLPSIDLVTVSGRVTAERSGRPVSIDAELVFTPNQTVPGAPTQPIRVLTRPVTGLRDVRGAYSVRLVRQDAVTYTVEILPRGEYATDFPPVITTFAWEQGETSTPSRDFSIVDRSGNFRRYSNTIVGLPPDSVGLGDRFVQAIDLGSGRLFSTVERTAGDGSFSLLLSENEDLTNWALQVRQAPDAAEGPIPTVVIPKRAAPEGVPIAVRSDSGGFCVIGTVEAPSRGTESRVYGASVSLRARTDEALEGVYAVDVLSNGVFSSPGASVACTADQIQPNSFDAPAVPGVYEIVIRPVERDLTIAYELTPRLTGPRSGQLYNLPRRRVLDGTLSAPDGRPMIGATVVAYPRGIPLPDAPQRPEARFNRLVEASVDDQGRFELPLDVGVYDLVFRSPEGSGFPWAVKLDYVVDQTEGHTAGSFALDYPLIQHGTVAFTTTGNVAGAEFTAYTVVGPVGARRSLPVARTFTRADGSYQLLLPPRL